MKKYRIPFLSLLCALLSVTIASCDDDSGISFGQQGDNGTVTPSKNITARMETPQALTDGSTILLSHSTTEGNGRNVMAYSLEYDCNKMHSRWVAFRFDGDTRAKNVSRSDEPFADDPKLPSDLKIGSGGFGRSYNRGHLCASADRLYSREANNITFYMSNMSPQLGSFNQGYWITLEGLVQKLGRDSQFADTLYVVKGGSIANGHIKEWLTRYNGKKVAVPQYYYMALLKVKNHTYSSIAFWMEHKEYGYSYDHPASLSTIKQHAVSVNELEELAGINFFPNLSDKEEEKVESQLIPANWGM